MSRHLNDFNLPLYSFLLIQVLIMMVGYYSSSYDRWSFTMTLQCHANKPEIC